MVTCKKYLFLQRGRFLCRSPVVGLIKQSLSLAGNWQVLALFNTIATWRCNWIESLFKPIACV